MSNQPRRLPQRAMDRRQFLIKSGLLGAAGLSLPAFLAACGGDDGGSGSTDTSASGGTAGGGSEELRILNWQAYIDEETVPAFEAASGVSVTYSEDYNDNNEIFNRLFVPIVGSGEVMDWDIVCPTTG